MRTYFEKDPQSARRKEDLFVSRTKTTELHELCLKTLEANIWNSPAEEVKDLTSLPQFTELIKTWWAPKYKCNTSNTCVTLVTILTRNSKLNCLGVSVSVVAFGCVLNCKGLFLLVSDLIRSVLLFIVENVIYPFRFHVCIQ